jgi:hypothetical protein
MIEGVLPNLDNFDNLKVFNVRTIEEAPHRQPAWGAFCHFSLTGSAV